MGQFDLLALTMALMMTVMIVMVIVTMVIMAAYIPGRSGMM